jgi:type IV fimbrial biogenesis protein FimT
MRQQGLTLLELLITLVILAILISVAIPGFSNLRQRDQVHTSALDFYSAIQLARSYAISHNRRVTMMRAGHWHNGWLIYEDSNNNGKHDDTEPVLWVNHGLGRVKVKSNKFVAKYISFIGSGEARMYSSHSKGAFQAGTFHFCHPDLSNMAFQLTLSKGGRVNMQKITENPCQLD